MNRAFVAASIPKTCIRRLSVTEVRCGDDALSRIKKKQAQFQVNDGVPVYIKGGLTDKILLFVTTACVGVGVMGGLHTAYQVATRR